jgi:hypothetical protein
MADKLLIAEGTATAAIRACLLGPAAAAYDSSSAGERQKNNNMQRTQC